MAEQSGQCRTPPDVKWLLNERAALAGEVAKARASQHVLQAKRERIELRLAAVQRLMERSQCAQSRAQASMDAIDATLALAHARVEPSAAGVVQAWAGRYGKRGALGECIANLLQQSAPAPMTTSVLIDLVARQFDVAFALPKDRRSFRKSVSSALTSLLKRDLIEPLHDRTEGSHGQWRWKPALPSLGSLKQMANARETAWL